MLNLDTLKRNQRIPAKKTTISNSMYRIPLINPLDHRQHQRSYKFGFVFDDIIIT